MNETIAIALITLSSGAIGAFSGAIGTIISVRAANKAALEQATIKEYFAARLNAYSKYYAAFAKFALTPRDRETEVLLYSALNEAILVASPKTTAVLAQIGQDIEAIKTLKHEQDKIEENKAALLLAMQEDLRSYQVPKVSS